ncbi:D-arabinono-1,4-lactone oxidase [Brevibacillus sp. NRS-1366]|uniref:D-arabinono-1,4-lactone oxidase n=1 Tax=Brevibacillus sp. NRS-1366 TaxID=3233899 RepID=UPI003D247F8E
MHETSEPPSTNQQWSYLKKMLIENGLFWMLSESCRLIPSLSKRVSMLSAQSVPSVAESGYSHQLFATPRLVRFYEMEYSTLGKNARHDTGRLHQVYLRLQDFLDVRARLDPQGLFVNDYLARLFGIAVH